MDKQFSALFILAFFALTAMLFMLLIIEKRNEALLELLVKRSPTCYETPR